MYLILSEGYENAGVQSKKTGKIWASMKNVHNGLGVRNMSDLILKEIYGKYQAKTLQMNKLKNAK